MGWEQAQAHLRRCDSAVLAHISLTNDRFEISVLHEDATPMRISTMSHFESCAEAIFDHLEKIKPDLMHPGVTVTVCFRADHPPVAQIARQDQKHILRLAQFAPETPANTPSSVT